MRKIIRNALIVVSLLIFMIAIVIAFLLNSTTIYNGIKIEGINVGGLDRSQAIPLLEDTLDKELRNSEVELSYNDNKYLVKLDEIGASYDYYKATEEAYTIGREGKLFTRLMDILNARRYGPNIEMDIKYDIQKISLIANKIAMDIDQESKNATIKYSNRRFIITPEIIGRKVNKQQLQTRIISVLKNKKPVNIPVEDDIPPVTEALLSQIKDPLGVGITSFQSSGEGRVHNINLAAKAINGKLLLPGEVFSFNDATGERSAETGYEEAKIILEGEFVDGLGGGVCQVSTTLYNAALLSDLEIVERYPHSIPSSYVEKGLDATVVDNYLDLKFKNSLSVPIYIDASTQNKVLRITIFGLKENKNRIIKIQTQLVEKIKPETDVTVDNSLMAGEKVIEQEGRYGYRIKTYKVFYEKGKEVKREQVSYDFYKPKKYIIKVGPKAEESNKNEFEGLVQ